MKEIPPLLFANATAIPSSETACITAETREYLLDLRLLAFLEFSNWSHERHILRPSICAGNTIQALEGTTNVLMAFS